MRFFHSALLILCMILSSFKLHSQDKIYLESGVKLGKVLDISATTITYKELSQNEIIRFEVGRVKLMFNQRGNFLVPDKMDFSDSVSRLQVKRFLDSSGARFIADQIYFITRKEIEDTISKEDEKFIYINHKGIEHKVDKRMVGAVIYKDGQYKLYHPIGKTADILLSCIQASYAAQLSNMGDTAKTSNGLTGVPKKNDLAKVTFEEMAGKVTKEEFMQKSYAKIHQFNSYLKILCDKAASLDEQDNAVDQAVKLFIDSAIIETSSVNSDVKGHYRVHDYLENLKNLRYDKIDITWTRVEYVSDIRLGTDGKYYGAISFEQTFRGYRDGHLVYEDVTKKTAEVELKMYEKNYLGNAVNQWDVLLSDIEVLTTKSL
jgi:hypothetical protein